MRQDASAVLMVVGAIAAYGCPASKGTDAAAGGGPATATNGATATAATGTGATGPTGTTASAGAGGTTGSGGGGAVYALPPSRRIAWSAGLDPLGGIPAFATEKNAVTDYGADNSGATNAATAINNCLAGTSLDHACYLPAGVYKLTASVTIPSRRVLRGARAAVAPWLDTTTDPAKDSVLVPSGAGVRVVFAGGNKASNWTPGPNQGACISSGYAQGSTQLTLAATAGCTHTPTTLAVGDFVSIYQNRDPAEISGPNDAQVEAYLGEDCGASCAGGDPHAFQQYSQVTAVAGNQVTLDWPIVSTTASPTGATVRKQTFGTSLAGLENVRLKGDGTVVGGMIAFHFARDSWVKGVETFQVGASSSGSPHVWADYSYRVELRDSYFHDGAGRDSGSDYGAEMFNWNSRFKIENNAFRHIRHSVVCESSCAGTAVLYNYSDDNGESVQGQPTKVDVGFLGQDMTPNHGAHPRMLLWEGNSAQSVWADYTHGSSSYGTVFRNHVRCDRSNEGLKSPPDFWACVEIEKYNRFYNLVGNVIGSPGWVAMRCASCQGTLIADATGFGWGGPATKWPVVFRFGYTSNGGSYADATSRTTALLHGNFDYVTGTQATWDGGAVHELPDSLYYAAKPDWWPAACAWPPYDPAPPVKLGKLPARERFLATASACD